MIMLIVRCIFTCSKYHTSLNSLVCAISLLSKISPLPIPDLFRENVAADGQNVFLNSLNYRCLVEEFGEPVNFPRVITAKVLEIDLLNQNHVRCVSNWFRCVRCKCMGASTIISGIVSRSEILFHPACTLCSVQPRLR